jgi:hypothetical protein
MNMPMTKQEVEEAYPVGKHLVMFLPPVWLLAGTVKGWSADRSLVHFENAVYLESPADGQATVGGVTEATTAKALVGSMSRSYPYRKGMSVQAEAILFHTEMATSPKALVDAADAAAIKGKR